MRRLAAALSTAALLIVGTALASPVEAATPTVVLDSLTIPAVQPGQAVSATARVHASSGSVAVQAITVAVRSGAAEFDFPGAKAATIGTAGYTYTSGSRTFVAGTYQAFVAVQVNGQWTNLAPTTTFTVAAATPSVVLDSLTVPAPVQPGQAVSATARVHASSGSVAVQAITVAVRSGSAAFDFPGAKAATIGTAGYTYTSGTRSFTAGTYQAFVAVQVNGVWTNLTPSTAFTVAAAANPVTFSQEFNGPAGASANDGLPSTTWWTDPCWKNTPEACQQSMAQYRDDLARLDGQGSLVLTANRTPDNGAMCGSVRCTYASARLTMRNWADPSGTGPASRAWTGGHFEARIKAPMGQGLWPAFWLNGVGDWPQNGEIDIFEAFGGPDPGQFVHAGPSWDNDISLGDTHRLPSGDITGWHTYAVDWDASANGHITWTVDGAVVQSFGATDIGSRWVHLQKPQALIVDLAVGGEAVGAPNTATVFPAKMYVDYIKVYERPMR